jgi:group I intron endonuclease
MATDSVVYLATNRLNGKRYIGVTSRGLAARRRQHETAPNGRAVTCRYFHAAVKKYGPDAFDWAVLATCDTFESALLEEVRLISKIKPEYNLTTGGQGAKGAVFSKERRERIASAKRGMKCSEEHCRNIGLSKKGIKHSPETIERRRLALLGRQCSAEHREKISTTLKGRKRPPDVVARMLATRAKTFAARMEASNGNF